MGGSRQRVRTTPSTLPPPARLHPEVLTDVFTYLLWHTDVKWIYIRGCGRGLDAFRFLCQTPAFSFMLCAGPLVPRSHWVTEGHATWLLTKTGFVFLNPAPSKYCATLLSEICFRHSAGLWCLGMATGSGWWSATGSPRSPNVQHLPLIQLSRRWPWTAAVVMTERPIVEERQSVGSHLPSGDC